MASVHSTDILLTSVVVIKCPISSLLKPLKLSSDCNRSAVVQLVPAFSFLPEPMVSFWQTLPLTQHLLMHPQILQIIVIVFQHPRIT